MIGLLLIAIGLILVLVGTSCDKKSVVFSGFIMSLFGLIVGIYMIISSILSVNTHKSPVELSKHANKTVLLIVYEDSIPVDTVVVFQSEKHDNGNETYTIPE